MGSILGIHHLCVRTKDIEKSLDFYCNSLGFALVSRETCPFGEYAMLRLGSSHLELIQPVPEEKDAYGSVGSLGHFGLAVEGIREVHAALLKKGVVFETEDVVVNKEPLGGFLSISFHGPDGEAINLYDFGAAKAAR